MVIIERFGQFHKELGGGIHFIIPFIDSIRSVFTSQEQLIDIPSQGVITSDNVSIMADGIIFIKIQDSHKATYEVENLKESIAQLAQTNLRSEIGKLALDQTLSAREQLSSTIQIALDDASQLWGVKTTRVEISNIDVPRSIQDSMELQMKAEREKRATETTAEAEKNATIAKAEGDLKAANMNAEAQERQAKADKFTEVQHAEGKKKAMELINDAMNNNPQSAEFLLAEKRVEAFSKIAASDSANKVVVPVEGGEMVGSLTSLTTLVGASLSPTTQPSSAE